MPFTRMGVRNTVPSSMARMVPLGLFHICFRSYSSTRAAFGVMVAHFTATPVLLGGLGGLDGDLVVGGVAVLEAQVVVLGLQVDDRDRSASSLIICQMMRVISSPSISTSGVVI